MEENVVGRKKPYQEHLKNADALVTTYEAVRAGFVALALEKNRRATPFVEQANRFSFSLVMQSLRNSLIRTEQTQILRCSARTAVSEAYFYIAHTP
jgi:hypothetical protein